MKVIGYVRVSTEEQAESGVSLAAQREKLQAYAKLYDVEIVEIVEDAGASGKSLQRPGLQRILGALKSGAADGLLIAKLDRLTRSVADMATLCEQFFSERAGKALLSVSDQVDTRTAAGRLVLNMLTSVAQWEREVIAERTTDALRHKKRAGKVYGPTPFGFDRTTDGMLVPSANDAATIQRARELHAAGNSLREIAALLTTEGRTPKRGGRWHAVTVARLVRVTDTPR